MLLIGILRKQIDVKRITFEITNIIHRWIILNTWVGVDIVSFSKFPYNKYFYSWPYLYKNIKNSKNKIVKIILLINSRVLLLTKSVRVTNYPTSIRIILRSNIKYCVLFYYVLCVQRCILKYSCKSHHSTVLYSHVRIFVFEGIQIHNNDKWDTRRKIFILYQTLKIIKIYFKPTWHVKIRIEII